MRCSGCRKGWRKCDSKSKFMEKKYIEDTAFEKIDFTETAMSVGEYDQCRFIHCNLSNVDLSNIVFSESLFTGCNISMAKLTKTSFKDCQFNDCKLLGLRFDDCDDFLFSVGFNNCNLHLCSFYKRRLKKAKFINSKLLETDFVETDLSGAVFENCDLAGAVFQNAVLEKTDFRTAFNYSIDPEINRIKKAKFSAPGIAGLLDKYDIEID